MNVDFDRIAEVVTPDQLARVLRATKRQGGYRCPFPDHDDDSPSFSIFRDGPRTAARCHGCGRGGSPVSVASGVWGVPPVEAAERLVSELGIHVGTPGNRGGGPEIVATYDYVDESGELLFQAVRFAPKGFRQRRPDGRGGWTWKLGDTRRVLYRLPDVIEAVALGKPVYVVEGEKDVLAIEHVGAVATCNPMGAGKWMQEYAEHLRGAEVRIIADRDEPGIDHARKIAASLVGVAESVVVLQAREGKDAADHLNAGHALDAFEEADVPGDPAADEPEPAMTTVEVNAEPEDARYSPDGFHLTDLGNARRLVARHGSTFRYVPEFGADLVWDGRRWERDRTGKVDRMAKRTVDALHKAVPRLRGDRKAAEALFNHAFRSEAEARLKAMCNLARTEPGVPVMPEELDADPWLFNVENGTLDLRTGELRPHDPNDLITKLAPVTFDPKAEAPAFRAFLNEIMGGDRELVEFVQRGVGCAMSGEIRDHTLFFCYGHGANGKSTLLNLLLTLFGEYGKQADPDLLVQKRNEAHPTGKADLMGARLVATSEINADRRMDEALVKQLTGGDRIKARFMRKDYFEFTPSHTLFLAANHKPVVKGTDEGIWRRIRMIPFNVTIPPERQDATLGERLQAELSGILNWALEGCARWQKVGLEAPAAVTMATDAYRCDMDDLGEFIGEHCVLDPRGEAGVTELYDLYREWGERAGVHTIARNKFGGQLKDRGFKTRRQSKTNRVIYLGIRINTSSEGTRSNLQDDRLENPHVEGNRNVPSSCFEESVDDLDLLDTEAVA